MNTCKCESNENVIGIPLAIELHRGHCSIAVDALSDFLNDAIQTQRALRGMGVDLSDAQSIQEGVQLFGLVRLGDLGENAPAGVPATNDESELTTKPAVTLVRACLKSAGAMAAPASSPTRNTVPEPPSTAGAPASIEGLDFELIRRRVAGGPDYVLLDGKPTPWSANLANPARCHPRPKPQPVAIEPVCSEVHLITSGNRRYHPGDAEDVSAVEAGSRVMVEACSTERMLFAGGDALVLQTELDLAEFQSEP